MKKRLLPLTIGLAALMVSGSAAFYSVFGLSKLFAGASTQVIIMAGSLEFAKLVCASLLYQYWDTINKWLRFYLSVAVFVLMVITSGGIYGFLSGAYQETATKSEFLDKSLAVLEMKQNRFEEQKVDLNTEKIQVNKTISDLRTSLSNPASVSYYSEDAGQVITTTSSSTRRALQKELETTINDRDNINLKLESVQDSIMRLDTELLDLEIGNEEQRELGPLKYLAEITGKDMGQVVNWFLLLIIFVFDPLAIAMVVAANFAFGQIKKPEEYEVEPEFFTDEVKCDIPNGMEYDKPYTVEEIKEAMSKDPDFSDDIPEEVPDMREPLGDWAEREIVIEDEDEVIVTPEQEEKIKWENNLNDEGEVVVEKYNIYGEQLSDKKRRTNILSKIGKLPRVVGQKVRSLLSKNKIDDAENYINNK